MFDLKFYHRMIIIVSEIFNVFYQECVLFSKILILHIWLIMKKKQKKSDNIFG